MARGANILAPDVPTLAMILGADAPARGRHNHSPARDRGPRRAPGLRSLGWLSAGNRDFLGSESLQGRHRTCRPYGTRLNLFITDPGTNVLGYECVALRAEPDRKCTIHYAACRRFLPAMKNPAAIAAKTNPHTKVISGAAKNRRFHPAPMRACVGLWGS